MSTPIFLRLPGCAIQPQALEPPVNHPKIPDAHLPNRLFQKRRLTASRFHERHPDSGKQHADRDSGNAGPRADIQGLLPSSGSQRPRKSRDSGKRRPAIPTGSRTPVRRTAGFHLFKSRDVGRQGGHLRIVERETPAGEGGCKGLADFRVHETRIRRNENPSKR